MNPSFSQPAPHSVAALVDKAFSQAEFAIHITDPEGVVMQVNQAYLKLYRFSDESEVVGRKQNIIRSRQTPSVLYRNMWETITSGHTWRGELTNVARDGSEVFIHLTITPLLAEGKVVGYMGFSLDRMQQVMLERQLFHANKLVILGTLGAGLAHELNNPLTSILLEAEYLEEALSDPEGPLDRKTALASTRGVIQGVARMKRVIEHLLIYSRKDNPVSHDYLPVADLVQDSFLFLEKQIRGRGIAIEVEVEEGLAVKGNKIQLESVLHNLLTNSRDAFEGRPEKDKRIRIRAFKEEERFATFLYRDNAGGIPAEALPRIFDPFFTTKGEEKGTGLGLSITRKIVSEHGGTIDCLSEGGKTEFTIRLPLL